MKLSLKNIFKISVSKIEYFQNINLKLTLLTFFQEFQRIITLFKLQFIQKTIM